jgi:pimeloyl-ACP methyl ester carboxylesterase
MVRKYGKTPFTVAVIHGGPGAPGYMAPVARRLAQKYGVLEPLQSANSVQGQIAELKTQIGSCTNQPVTLIGSSWGAVLSLLFTARHQETVNRLILIGCGTFSKEDSAKVESIRNQRLKTGDKKKLQKLLEEIDTLPEKNQNKLMADFAGIFETTDNYKPITGLQKTTGYRWSIFRDVWSDFVKLRDKQGYIEKELSKITVPVTLIQGDYDPHPANEVYSFLKKYIPQTELYKLERCGHYPWREKYARDKFYQILSFNWKET